MPFRLAIVNGAEFIQLLMPVISGAELTQKVKLIRPDIPVIVCTGSGQLLTHEKILELGVAKVIYKPLFIKEIAETLREVLDTDSWNEELFHETDIGDDDVELRTMISEILDRSGHETVQAPDGNEGLRLHRSRPADLVITDIFMPEKEGVETIRLMFQIKSSRKTK